MNGKKRDTNGVAYRGRDAKMIHIMLPLPKFMKDGKTKLFTMNDYRNAHYMVQNKVKNKYMNEAGWALLPYRSIHFERVAIEYVIFFETGHRKDIGNIGAVIDKFFSDAIVKSGIVADDSQKYVEKISFRYGGIGPERVEITIEEIE